MYVIACSVGCGVFAVGLVLGVFRLLDLVSGLVTDWGGWKREAKRAAAGRVDAESMHVD